MRSQDVLSCYRLELKSEWLRVPNDSFGGAYYSLLMLLVVLVALFMCVMLLACTCLAVVEHCWGGCG